MGKRGCEWPERRIGTSGEQLGMPRVAVARWLGQGRKVHGKFGKAGQCAAGQMVVEHGWVAAGTEEAKGEEGRDWLDGAEWGRCNERGEAKIATGVVLVGREVEL